MNGIGSVFRALTAYVDAVLHTSRHRAVIARLRQMRRPRTILVVCYANVCRSPYLEALLRRALPDVTILSAGFLGQGRRVPEHSITVAARIGIDLSGHRSQVLTTHIVANADLCVVMDAPQARALSRIFGAQRSRVVIAGDLDTESADTRAIRDPWNEPMDVFESSFARLGRCAERLVSALNGTDPRD